MSDEVVSKKNIFLMRVGRIYLKSERIMRPFEAAVTEGRKPKTEQFDHRSQTYNSQRAESYLNELVSSNEREFNRAVVKVIS